jgi:endonuclease/exonuclease/phosphatase family metal-dependent hydrolase
MTGAALSLSVASMNLHCGRDRDGYRFAASEVIKSLDADVVLLQENWRAASEPESIASAAARENSYPYCIELDVLSATSLFSLGVVTEPTADQPGDFGLAILSRLPTVARGHVGLGLAPGDMMERAALLAEVCPGDGRPVITVVNAHLTHRLLHGPGQLRHLVRAVRDSNHPTLIAGDMNMCRPAICLAWPFRPVIRGRTWPSEKPWAQLDHILTGADIQRTSGQVCPAAGSDHRPVRATLRIGLAGGAGE